MPRGPAFGRLAKGESVEVERADGSMSLVRPEDVIGPSLPGACVLFLRAGEEDIRNKGDEGSGSRSGSRSEAEALIQWTRNSYWRQW